MMTACVSSNGPTRRTFLRKRRSASPMKRQNASGSRRASWASTCTRCATGWPRKGCAMSDGILCMWMRGGTSKGGYFLAADLPFDRDARDTALMQIMGTPDPRQIDGLGGADPLTSKVAVVAPSARDGIDVDYLFLQVFVDRPIVTDSQNCGNILAGIGPFAIERGLVPAQDGETPVTIFMENTGQVAVARVPTPGG